jgi:hypothetical protein
VGEFWVWFMIESFSLDDNVSSTIVGAIANHDQDCKKNTRLPSEVFNWGTMMMLKYSRGYFRT